MLHTFHNLHIVSATQLAFLPLYIIISYVTAKIEGFVLAVVTWAKDVFPYLFGFLSQYLCTSICYMMECSSEAKD